MKQEFFSNFSLLQIPRWVHVFYLCLFVMNNAIGREAINQTPIVQDSLMPDAKNDHFVILTSDTVLYKEQAKHWWEFVKGKVFRHEALTQQSAGIKTEEIYTIDYIVHRDGKIVFMFDHWQPEHRKVVLPKAILKEITPIDINEKFPWLGDNESTIKFIDSLWYGRDLGKVEKLRASANSDDKWEIELAPKLKEHEKRIWLIDRRYITADSVTLLEVWPMNPPRGFKERN